MADTNLEPFRFGRPWLVPFRFDKKPRTLSLCPKVRTLSLCQKPRTLSLWQNCEPFRFDEQNLEPFRFGKKPRTLSLWQTPAARRKSHVPCSLNARRAPEGDRVKI